jgi:aminopeptidase N
MLSVCYDRRVGKVAVWVGLLLVSSVAAAQTLQPTSYAITLAPDAAHDQFSGHERVELTLPPHRTTLRFDAVGLEITEADLIVGTEREHVAVTTEPNAITVHLGKASPGPVTVELAWRGTLSHDLYGLYVTEAAGREYLFTQLEPNHARRVFPCIDAPGVRARFQLQAVVAESNDVVSNERVVGEQPGPGAGMKTVTFATTPPLPPFLVSLAIGRFERLEGNAGRVHVSIVTLPGEKARAAFALRTTTDLIPRVERYLDAPYPFDKLDVVAVPQMGPHGMENAGAIFIRHDELLLEEKSASLDTRITLARRIAHELAHQWFGDLVAIAGWNDLWLSEGLARWAELTFVDEAMPAAHVWDRFRAQIDHALVLDLSSSSHAVQTRFGAAPAFDLITYDKGAATLRMIQRWIGEDSFRSALQDYVHARAFGVGSAQDFWRALAAHSSAETVTLARSWLDQPGFPDVTVDAECTAGVLELSLQQHRSFARGHHLRPRLWPIPLDLHADSTELRLVLRGAHARVRIREAAGCTRPAALSSEPDCPYHFHYALDAAANASAHLPRTN